MTALLVFINSYLIAFYIAIIIKQKVFMTYLCSYAKFNKENWIFKVTSYIEVAFMILMLFMGKNNIQALIFTFILLGWMLLWAFYIPFEDLIINDKKRMLFLVILTIIYIFLLIINLQAWTKMT